MPVWPVILIALVLIGLVIYLSPRGRIKVWFKSILFSFGIESDHKTNINSTIKNQNWVVAPNEGKYDFSTGTLRHIPDPETLESLGYDRSKFVRWDIKRFEKESIGHEITSVKKARLIRKENTSGVYVIIEGKKRWVPDPETLEAIGRNFDEVENISKEEFDNIPQGESLKKKSDWTKNNP